MFRGLYYGSYKAPREVLWILGVILYLLMMATAFFGYVLPWGQMSFWGATVITNFFSALDQITPHWGSAVATWLWGGFAVGDATLNRFFSLHYLLPFVIAGVVGLHIWALHVPGNNNPLGIDVKGPQDTVPFHPYYTVKDGFYVALFILIYLGFVFYAPNFFGNPDNYIPANPVVTPPDIVPEWYLLPYYAMLRSVPQKLIGVLVMAGSLITLVFIPWLDTSKVRSTRFRPMMKQFFWFFVAGLPDPGLLRIAERRRDADVHQIPLVWVARIATALLLRFLLADHAASGPHRDAKAAAGLHRATRTQPGRVRMTNMKALPLAVLAFLPCASDRAFATGRVDFSEPLHPKAVRLSFEGPFGTYDRAAWQRGFQVYKEVCSACHSLSRVAFHDLTFGFSEAQAKALAAGYKLPADPNDKGETTDDKGERLTRPGILADHFPPPFRERGSRARQQWRRAAAGPLADRQGARGRARNTSIRSSLALARSRRKVSRYRRASISTPTSLAGIFPCRPR